MQKKNIKKRSIQGTGQGIHERAEGQATVCRGTAEAANADVIIADSLHSVAFDAKRGSELMFRNGVYFRRVDIFRGDSHDIEPEQMLADLSKCYEVAHKLLKPSEEVLTPTVDLPVWKQIDFFIDTLKSILPHGYNLNVDYDYREEYYFTIYVDCAYNDIAYYMCIGNALKHLAKHNRNTHDLFIEFLKIFMLECGIYGWWDNMDWAIDCIGERVENGEYDNDDDDEIAQVFASYKVGKVRSYQNMLQTGPRLEIDEVERRASRLRKDNPIRKIIEGGCTLMKEYPYTWHQFEYEADSEEYGNEGLRHQYLFGVAWNEDAIWRWHEEYIDSEAGNNGMNQPYAHVHVHIDSKTKEIDLQKLLHMRDFPSKLAGYMNYCFNILSKYERHNK